MYSDVVDDGVQMRRPSGGAYPAGDYYFHQDDQGNVLLVTDASGAAVERYDYDDFGYPTIIDPATGQPRATSAIGNRYLFTGREWDADTRLYHYRFRDYDPSTGRFLQRDPLGVWGDLMNLGNGSAYVGNNPWSAVDPYGLQGSPMNHSAGVGFMCSHIQAGNPAGYRTNDDLTLNEEFAFMRTTASELLDPRTRIGSTVGFFEGVWSGLGGLWDLVTSPIDTSKRIVGSARNALKFAGWYYDNPYFRELVNEQVRTALTNSASLSPWERTRAAMKPVGQLAVPLALWKLLNIAKAAAWAKLPPWLRQLLINGCFVAGTLVATPSGDRPIEEIKAGDEVWSVDTDTGEIRPARVVEAYRRENVRLVEVELDDEEIITTTQEHPFWVVDSGWTAAKNLRSGMKLRTMEGNSIEIARAEILDSTATVYNFMVEGQHNYFVGNDGVLVHNIDCPLRSLLTTEVRSRSRKIASGPGIGDVDRLVREYGGRRSGWVKKSTTDVFEDVAGNPFEIHWYEHPGIGIIEAKPNWLTPCE